MRWYERKGKYIQATLGTADDVTGAGTLTFEAGRKAALNIVEAARLEAKAMANGPLMTVRLAVEQYIALRDAKDTRCAGKNTRSNASQRLRRHVTCKPLADVALHTLTEQQLKSWRGNLYGLKGTTVNRLANGRRISRCQSLRTPRDSPGCNGEQTMLDKHTLSIAEVTKALGVGRSPLDALIKEGRLPVRKLGTH